MMDKNKAIFAGLKRSQIWASKACFRGNYLHEKNDRSRYVLYFHGQVDRDHRTLNLFVAIWPASVAVSNFLSNIS